MMESEYNLKPCPFCGDKAELIVAPGYFKSGLSSSGWLVKCTNGCCNQMPYMSDHDAVEAWNRRETAQPEPLTDKEQRIFLAAMGREEKVCEEVDRNYVGEPYEDSLMRVCKEIRRKVKGALWT